MSGAAPVAQAGDTTRPVGPAGAALRPRFLARLLTRSSLAGLPTLALAVFLCCYSWLPLAQAQWLIIDDHEIMTAIGTRERLPLAEIPAALRNTEVGSAGTASRFRPSYYLLRFLEAAAWGKHPGGWWATRISIALLTSVLLAAVCLSFAGPVMSFGFVAFALSRPYWSDIFARLGPAETYATLGTCLVVLGTWLGLARRFGAAACSLIVLGCVVAAGSKENFVLLAAVPVWLIVSPPRPVPRAMRALLAGAVIFSLWIALTVGLGVLKAGHDVYSQDVSAGSRLALLAGLLQRPEVQWWLLLAALLLVVASLLRLRTASGQQGGALASNLARGAGILSLLFTVYLTQYLFYFGKWPAAAPPRYLFPGVLAAELALLVWLVAIGHVIGAGLPDSRWRWAFPLAVCAGFLGLASDDWQQNRTVAQRMVVDTTLFTHNIEVLAALLKPRSEVPVIVLSHDVWDYEPVVSVQSFLRANGVTNPLAVELAGYSAASYQPERSPVEHRLATQLETWQSSGGQGLTPYAGLNLAAGCVSLGMSGPADERCAVRGRIR